MEPQIDLISTHNLVCIKDADTLFEADYLMTKNNIRHLPVINSEGTLVGMLSKSDFSALKKIGQSLIDYQVKLFMSSPVKVVSSTAKVSDVAQILVRYKINSILVIKKNQITGIVTTEDILRMLAERAEKEQENEMLDLEALADEGWISSVATH